MKNTIGKFFMKVIARVLLVGMALPAISWHAQASNVSNYVEMGLALAAVPVDIAKQHHVVSVGKGGAPLLSLSSDVLSVLTKVFYFYNNRQVQKSETGRWAWNRDCVVNGVWLLRDITKLKQHWDEYSGFKYNKYLAVIDAIANDQDNYYWLDDRLQQDDAAVEFMPIEVSTLEYVLRVYVWPTLKGLSAFAVALSQDESQSFACREARFIATSVHSLTRLAEEYAELEAGSPYKMVIGILLVANTAWLIKEIKDCYDTYHVEPIDCEICLEEGTTNYTRLNCGHAYCRACMVGHFNAAIDGGRVTNLTCPHDGCNHVITNTEVHNIAHGDARFVVRYGQATLREFIAQNPGMRHCPTPGCDNVFDNEHNDVREYHCAACNQRYCANCCLRHPATMGCAEARAADPAAREHAAWIAAGNGRHCPRCTVLVQRTEGCNHMTCRCTHEFCYICGANWNMDHYGCRR